MQKTTSQPTITSTQDDVDLLNNLADLVNSTASNNEQQAMDEQDDCFENINQDHNYALGKRTIADAIETFPNEFTVPKDEISALLRQQGVQTIEQFLHFAVSMGVSKFKTMLPRRILASDASFAEQFTHHMACAQLTRPHINCHTYFSKSMPKKYLPTGCKHIDDMFFAGKGIVHGQVTELVGAAGSGKSTMCLQFAITCLKQSQAVLFISTEQTAGIMERTMQMLACNSMDVEASMAKFLISKVGDAQQLEQSIADINTACTLHHVQLIIIDSIAQVYRQDYKDDQIFQRAEHMFSIASAIREIAYRHNVPVLMVNQVTANIKDFFVNQTLGDETTFDAVMTYRLGEKMYNSNLPKEKPALGLTWSNCINTQIMIEKKHKTVTVQDVEWQQNTNDDDDEEDARAAKKQKTSRTTSKSTTKSKNVLVTRKTEQPVRVMHVLQSSQIPLGTSCAFCITNAGLTGVE